MQKAKEDIEKAKAEMKAFEDFVNSLHADGFINKDGAYTIEIKEGKLIIDGKEQPAEVYNKHRAFLDKQKNTTIKKTADDFNIHKN